MGKKSRKKKIITNLIKENENITLGYNLEENFNNVR